MVMDNKKAIDAQMIQAANRCFMNGDMSGYNKAQNNERWKLNHLRQGFNFFDLGGV